MSTESKFVYKTADKFNTILDFLRTEGHQRLKRFLHPSCEVCNKEFPARMEWVEHKFTPEHLRALKESLENKVGEEGKPTKHTCGSGEMKNYFNRWSYSC